MEEGLTGKDNAEAFVRGAHGAMFSRRDARNLFGGFMPAAGFALVDSAAADAASSRAGWDFRPNDTGRAFGPAGGCPAVWPGARSRRLQSGSYFSME